MILKTLKLNIDSDKIGIISSILCLIHCLAIPLIFALSAEALHFSEHEFPFLDYTFAFVALIAAVLSSRKTDNRRLKKAFAIGWLMFIVGVIFHDSDYLVYLLHLGSLVLIISHYFNIKACSLKIKRGAVYPYQG